MILPGIPSNEAERIKALLEFDILELQKQEEFDFLTSLAAEICEAPISLISLINVDKLFGLYKIFHQHNDAKGIGLYITKQQVEAMKGKIEVSSQLGEGTIFKVFLPKF